MLRKHILLVEMHNLRVRLLEDRMDFLRKSFAERLTAKFPNMHMDGTIKDAILAQPGETTGDKVLAYVAGFDPDPTKKSTQWLLNLLMKGGMQFEDLPEAQNLLTQFMQFQRQLPQNQRDIQRFPSLGDLHVALVPFTQHGTPEVSQREKDRQLEKQMYSQAKVVFNDENYRILIPVTKEASIYFGRNTRWCTAATYSSNYFDSYSSKGPLYIILDKANNKRWQFHFETNSYMDEMDRPINVKAFLAEHPDINAFFETMDDTKTELGTVNGMIALQDETGISFKDKLGAFGSARVRINAVDGVITTTGNLDRLEPHDAYFPYYDDRMEDWGTDLTDIIEKSGLRAHDDKQPLADVRLFYHNHQWGRLWKVGDTLQYRLEAPLAFCQWKGIEGSTSYYVIDDENHEIGLLEVRIAADGTVTADKDRMGEEGVLEALVTFLVSNPKAKRLDPEADSVQAAAFTEAQAAHIIEKKPDMATMTMLYKANGPTDPTFREKLLQTLKDEYINTFGFADDQHVILEEFKNVYDFAEDNESSSRRDNSLEYVLKALKDGVDYYDDFGSPESYQKREFIEGLDLKDRHLLGRYFQNTYADEIADWEEQEGETFDPMNAAQIVDLQDTVDDDGLNDAFNRAFETGHRYGAEKDMSDAFHHLINGVDDLFFAVSSAEGETKWERTDKWHYDQRCAIAAPIADLIEEFEKEGNLAQIEREGSWLGFKDEKLYLDSPQYGWNGYDDKAAAESFSENVHEFLPDADPSDTPAADHAGHLSDLRKAHRNGIKNHTGPERKPAKPKAR